ncbi:hypothetical protein Tco_1016211 [Tanacetum coccineum]|uniref:Reverse transcriptase domain-containing protein n=1 Tax=Tanacetum coccineum TaxID=301880 RepID=A0ABQ5FN11_9ASTR
MRQRRWLELLADYDCEIRYHPGKANKKKQQGIKTYEDMDKAFEIVLWNSFGIKESEAAFTTLIMNQEQIRQVNARDEKWVPTKERVKISTTNGVDFAEVLDDESTLTFLIDLCYKGPLYKYPSMYVDHMHQPWRTLAAIINKCLSGKKTLDTPKAAIDVSKESDSKPARKITAGRRVIKKKVTIFADDNIIPDPDVALELGKDTSSVTKKLSPDPSQKLKSVLTLNPKEKLATDTMKALKENKKTNRRQPGTEGSTEGTSRIPEVLNESTIVPATSSEGIDDDEDDDDDDDKSIDLEKIDDEETDDEFVHNGEYVQTDDEFVQNAEKTEEVKDDTKKVELPLTSSSLSVSSGFGNQFLNLSFDTSLIDITPTPETPSVAPATTLLPLPYVSSISHVPLQSTKPIPTPPITTEAPSVTMILDPLHVVIQRVYVLAKDVQELKEADNTTTLSASLKSKIPSVVYAFLGSSLGNELHKVLQRHTEELIQKYPQQIDYKEMVKEFVQANLINEVKNQLPTLLPKAVSDFATPVIESTMKKALEKTPLPLSQSSSQA